MSRRPKLSLSPEVNIDKKQAKGFKTSNPSPKQTDPTPNTTYGFTRSMDADPFPSGNENAIPKPAARPNRERIVKLVFVVVAAVISLYLLKRRLF